MYCLPVKDKLKTMMGLTRPRVIASCRQNDGLNPVFSTYCLNEKNAAIHIFAFSF